MNTKRYKKLLAGVLTLAMLCSLLPSTALGAETQLRRMGSVDDLTEAVERTEAGPGPEGQVNAPPETETPSDPSEQEPLQLRAALMEAQDTVAEVRLPEKDSDPKKNVVYCNNTAVVIKKDTDGETYLYDSTGTTKLLDGAAITDGSIYGGSKQVVNERVDTSVIMESGSVYGIYGGDMFSTRTGNTKVIMKGGTAEVIYGGSYGYEGGFGIITGNTNVTLEGGYAKYVYGGGRVVGSEVTGTCNVTATANASATYLFGGSDAGSAGSTNVRVENNAEVTESVVGGGNAGSRTGDVAVYFAGETKALVGGAYYNCSVRDVNLTLAAGGIVDDGKGGMLWAAGQYAGTTTRNVKLTLAGGTCSYIYGGAGNGIVTGDVQIDVTAYTSGRNNWTTSNIRAGGMNASSVVEGNTVVNLSAGVWGMVTGGGYEGVVKGTATVNVLSYNPGDRGVCYLNGQSNYGETEVVKKTTTLNFIDAPSTSGFLRMDDNIKRFDETNFTRTRFEAAQETALYNSALFSPKNLTLDAGSTLKIGKSGVAVSGNFTGGGTLEIKEGNTFSVAGSTTGTTTITLTPAGSILGSSFKVIAGANAQLANYTLAATAEDYELVKKNDGIYAVNPAAVGLTVTQSAAAPAYGDPLTLTVTPEANKGVTTAGTITLTLTRNGVQKHTATQNVSGAGKAAFVIPPTLGAGTYDLNATFIQAELVGSVTQPLVIAKRTLTLKADSLKSYDRPYSPGNTDVNLPADFFANAVLEGYYTGESGGTLFLCQYLYRLKTDTVGRNKAVSTKPTELSWDHGSSAAAITDNYKIAAPDIAISITPKPVKEITFADTAYDYSVGTPLSERPLTGGDGFYGSFAWQNPDENPPVGTASFNVVFTPKDAVNYDFSRVSGYDATSKTVIRAITVITTKKEKPTDAQVTHTYTVGSEARTVTVALDTAMAYPQDAGTLSFAYQSSSATAGQLTDISVAGSTLTFTIPANATTGAGVARLPVSVTSTNYVDFTLTVGIDLSSKQAVTVSGIKISGLNEQAQRFYSGAPVTYEGTPNIEGGYDGALDYEWHAKNGTLLDEAPKNEGVYYLLVKVPESNTEYAGSLRLDFTITMAHATIRALDQRITVGDDAPTYTASFDGFAPGESATVTFTCDYTKNDPVDGKVGTYTITPSNCVFTVGSADNYHIGYQYGTLTVEEKAAPPSGGGSNTTTSTEKNPDGSTTTTVTDKKTGTVTETTKKPDGTTQVIETKKDGTVTESISTPDGTKTEQIAKPDGSMTATETRKDGTKLESATTAEGKTTATVTLPQGKEGATTVVIPTPAKPAPGEVAVIVKEDGTREVVKTSVSTQDGLRVTLTEGAKLEIVDNSKTFGDVADSAWYADAVAFASSRELFGGVGKGNFAPETEMTRAMLWTVLARFDGQDISGGANWYENAQAWAKESGVSDGSGPEDGITREQLAVILYRYAGSPEVGDVVLSEFDDADSVSDWAADAMRWCVDSGILNGSSGSLNPSSTASRAEVAIMLQRFIADIK